MLEVDNMNRLYGHTMSSLERKSTAEIQPRRKLIRCVSRHNRVRSSHQSFVWLVVVAVYVIICIVYCSTGTTVDMTTTTVRYWVMGNTIVQHNEAYDDELSFSSTPPHNHHEHHHHSTTGNNNSRNHNNTVDMCHDMYMTMYMDGFHWSLFHYRHLKSPPQMICLNYFVSTWKVQYPSEFRGCMIYTFLLAILLEAISSIRTMCAQYFQERKNDLSRTLQQHISRRSRRRHQWRMEAIRQLITIILYTFQTIIGYLLMLVAMSYSMELLLSIFSGLIIGNGLFVRYHNNSDDQNNYINTNNNNEETLFDDNENLNSDDTNRNSRYEQDTPNDEAQALLPNSSNTRRQSTHDGIIRRRG